MFTGFIVPLILWLGILVVLIVLFWFLLRIFKLRRLGIVFGLAHVCFVSIVAIIVYNGLHQAQIELIWLFPLLFDFPVSLLYGLFVPVILNMIDDSRLVSSLLVPFAFHGIFGSVQYYLIGTIVDYFRTKKQDGQKKGSADSELST